MDVAVFLVATGALSIAAVLVSYLGSRRHPGDLSEHAPDLDEAGLAPSTDDAPAGPGAEATGVTDDARPVVDPAQRR